MATFIDLTRSTSHSFEYRPGRESPTQKLQGHPWRVLTRMNYLMARQHWSPIVTCHNGTLRGSPTDLIINAMPNKEPPTSSALLGLPSPFSGMQTPRQLSIATSGRALATSKERSLVSLFFLFLVLEP
jgi:hypothetical protein